MSEYKNQKAIKPQAEDMIHALVNESQRQAALDFIEYIKSNKMTPAWATTNAWKFNYKGKRIGYFRISDDGNWTLSVFAQYDRYLDRLLSDESDIIKLFTTVQIENYIPCGGCMPGVDRQTVTKEFNNICACSAINLINPDQLFCEFAKKLIALRRDAIANDRVPKCNYIKPADRT